MKTFFQFMKEAKEIVRYVPPISKPRPNPEHESERGEVIHGVFEEIQEKIGPDKEVSTHLKSHENPHELIGGILSRMKGSDAEFRDKHGLNTPEGIAHVHRILSNPGYVHGT